MIKFLMQASQNMSHHSCFVLLSFVSVVSSHSVPIGAASSFDGDAVAHSDYTLHLQPPQDTSHDIEASLDAIMKAEDEKRTLSDDEFEEAKQSMIKAEKQRIRDMVRNALVAQE